MNIDNQFIHEHTALVNCIASQYSIPSIPHEDLVQEGLEAWENEKRLQKTQKKMHGCRKIHAKIRKQICEESP